MPRCAITRLGAATLVFFLLGAMGRTGVAAEGPPLAARLGEVAEQVALGTISATTAADDILAALAASPVAPDDESTFQCLRDALRATLLAAGTLHAGPGLIDVHPFPHGGRCMLTPWYQYLGPVVAEYVAVYDRLETSLAARGLGQALAAVEAGLTIWYDVPQARAGEVCRLQLTLASVRELTRARASLTLNYGDLSATFSAQSLAGTADSGDEEAAKVWVYIYTYTGPLDLTHSEPDLPPALAPAELRLTTTTVFDDSQPSPSADEDTMHLSIPLSWGKVPSDALVRLYYCALGGSWEYRPGVIDARGRLQADVPMRDGTLVLLMPTTEPPGAPASDIAVIVNGAAVDLDVAARILSGRALVPLRAVTEALGASVDWDGTLGRATLVREGRTVILDVGGNVGVVDGRPVTMDVPAFICGDRVLVLLRFVAEAFGASVAWDARRREVDVRL